MKLLLSFCLIIASSATLADPPGQPCETFTSTDEVSEPLTIADIEREDMPTLSQKLELRSDYPQVPFGVHVKENRHRAIKPGRCSIQISLGLRRPRA